MPSIPIYILKRTPGVDPATAVEWTTICHSREPFVWVSHDVSYSVSRWVTRERKRKFVVRYSNGRASASDDMSHHMTLEAAMKAAKQVARNTQAFLDARNVQVVHLTQGHAT